MRLFLWIAFFLTLTNVSASPCLPSQCGVVNANTGGDTTITANLNMSTTIGALIEPRQTTSQINALNNPVDGSQVYDTVLDQFKGRLNGAWLPFFTGGFQVYVM